MRKFFLFAAIMFLLSKMGVDIGKIIYTLIAGTILLVLNPQVVISFWTFVSSLF